MKYFIIILLIYFTGVFAQDSSATKQDQLTEVNQDSIITPTAKTKSGVFIFGTPDSMGVKVDGVVRGVTPLTISDLSDGEHTVVLTKKGFYGKKINITTVKDSLIEIDAELRAPGTITIASDPEGALIFMNKKKIDKTPFTISTVRPGTYSIMLLRGGFAQYDTTIEVISGLNDTLFAKMNSSTPVTDTVTRATTTTTTATAKNVSDETSPEPEDSEVEHEDEKKRKKIFKIIGSAIVATFLTIIMISELSGDEN